MAPYWHLTVCGAGHPLGVLLTLRSLVKGQILRQELRFRLQSIPKRLGKLHGPFIWPRTYFKVF